MPAMKYREAYRLYTIFWSCRSRTGAGNKQQAWATAAAGRPAAQRSTGGAAEHPATRQQSAAARRRLQQQLQQQLEPHAWVARSPPSSPQSCTAWRGAPAPRWTPAGMAGIQQQPCGACPAARRRGSPLCKSTSKRGSAATHPSSVMISRCTHPMQHYTRDQPLQAPQPPTSLVILARSFWLSVVYHLANRTLPCRLSSSTKRICQEWGWWRASAAAHGKRWAAGGRRVWRRRPGRAAGDAVRPWRAPHLAGSAAAHHTALWAPGSAPSTSAARRAGCGGSRWCLLVPGYRPAMRCSGGEPARASGAVNRAREALSARSSAGDTPFTAIRERQLGQELPSPARHWDACVAPRSTQASGPETDQTTLQAEAIKPAIAQARTFRPQCTAKPS